MRVVGRKSIIIMFIKSVLFLLLGNFLKQRLSLVIDILKSENKKNKQC